MGNTSIIRLTTFACFLSLAAFTFAQDGKIKKGDKLFNKFSYKKAIAVYEDVKNPNISVYRNLAHAYLKTHDFVNAESSFFNVVGEADYTADDAFDYASILRTNQKYSESNKWMKKFAEMKPEDLRAKNYTESIEDFDKIKTDQKQFTVTGLSLNSANDDMGATFYKDQVVYASTKTFNYGVNREWNGNQLPFLDLYVADKLEDLNLENPVKLRKQTINNKYHEGPATFNEAGDYMIFTRNNYEEKSEDGSRKLQLFESSFVNDEWSEPVALKYNSKEYSTGHPSLSKDGNTLYFASDMSGGYGGVDIYRAKKDAEGNWGEAQNVGNQINTEGDEMFPHLHASGDMIFFSSNGRLGLGGLDVYATQIMGSKFGKVLNLGVPVNSSHDDFSFVLDEPQKKGYLTSNRTSGQGNDDLYAITMLKPFKFGKQIKGVAKDKDGNILADAVVKLTSKEDGSVIDSIITNEEGKYLFNAKNNTEYVLLGDKDDFFQASEKVSTKTDKEVITKNVVLDKKPHITLYGLITDADTKKPIDGVTIVVMDNMLGTEETFTTDSNGDFLKKLDEAKLNDRISYNFTISKDSYITKTTTYNKKLSKPGQYNVHEEMDLSLSIPAVGKDIGKMININPIYFDYDKSNIRPDAAIELDKIVQVMKENPTMVIELGSHTDCRGSDKYNKSLSNRRAKSSAEYIKKRISNAKNIYGKGYGETTPAKGNNCKCDDCSDAQHDLNRRTEFKIIKM